jgi:hypothetical protein
LWLWNWLLVVALDVGFGCWIGEIAVDPFIAELNDQHWNREQKRKDAFWSGHSLYQIPMRVLGYKGTAKALVLSYFYERANSAFTTTYGVANT